MAATTADFEAWADQAETGWDVDWLESQPSTFGTGALQVLPFYLTTQLRHQATQAGLSDLEVMQAAIEDYLQCHST